MQKKCATDQGDIGIYRIHLNYGRKRIRNQRQGIDNGGGIKPDHEQDGDNFSNIPDKYTQGGEQVGKSPAKQHQGR